MSVKSEIIARLREFTEALESGEKIIVTEVRCEQTPDGPIHIRRRKELKTSTLPAEGKP